MKKIIPFILFLFAFSCTSNYSSWQYIQDRGGISLGNPFYKSDIVFIPINCDATGLTEITSKPIKWTSAPIYFISAKTIKKGNSIYILLNSRLREKGENINEIKLGKLKKGDYRIFYLDNKEKVFLKEIRI